jgi:drug/metabolite transporter (DMT)-like permease
MVGIGFPILLLISLITHRGNGTMKQLVIPLTSNTFILSIIFLGMVQLATAFLSSYTLSKLETSKISVFTNLSTIIAIAVGAIFLQEEVTWYHVIGSILIVMGVIGTNLRSGKSNLRGKLANDHL